jgi:hypothetical protein
MLTKPKVWKLGQLASLAIVIMMTIVLFPVQGFSHTYTIYPADSASVVIGETDISINLWLGIDYARSSNIWYAYLKYDLSSIPATATITSATLMAYCDVTVPDEGVVTQLYAVSDNSWSRDTITWDNKPASGALLSTTNTTVNSWSQWVISKDNIVPNGQVSFMLMIPEGGGVEARLGGKNNPNEPYLRITTPGGNEAAINLLLLSN